MPVSWWVMVGICCVSFCVRHVSFQPFRRHLRLRRWRRLELVPMPSDLVYVEVEGMSGVYRSCSRAELWRALRVNTRARPGEC